MDPDRKIGKITRVSTNQALVELSSDTGSYVKSNIRGLYEVGVVNSYVIIPVGAERVVALVTSLDMSEEHEANLRNRQMLVLAKARRTMWLSMVGTISRDSDRNRFNFGVRRYPELDNPVWFATEEDLDAIFEKDCSDLSRRNRLISLGTSPIFTDYAVKIDMDKFFGKHAAILGNTGSGKSCTVTAVIKAVLGDGATSKLPHAHFIIFDINAEYSAAFTDESKDPPVAIFNRLILSNNGNVAEGFWLPHWFMNSRDYHAFFKPGDGAQGPILYRAIGSARARNHKISSKLEIIKVLELSIDGVESCVASPPTGNQASYAVKKIIEHIDGLSTFLRENATDFTESNLESLRLECTNSIDPLLKELKQAEQFAALTAPRIFAITQACRQLRDIIAFNNKSSTGKLVTPVGIDTPTYFDFDAFVTDIFRKEVELESETNPGIKNWVGTLTMRLEQARQDPRYEFLFGVPAFTGALASFMRLILGVEPAKNFKSASTDPPWTENYQRNHSASGQLHNITIINLSQLASDVLENVTALLGRLILEFMQRCPERGSYPIVLVLEEAHHYIPASATSERQLRAREVFERIAKEGRKYGLSLVIASQRPSELSKTVISQCNSFIIHRIQNPDDRDYFRSVIPDINKDLLEQLPTLPQQHAIVLGDCITIPLQVRINDVSPKPRSSDPEFFNIWSKPDSPVPNFEEICTNWENTEYQTTEESAVIETDTFSSRDEATSSALDETLIDEDEIPF